MLNQCLISAGPTDVLRLRHISSSFKLVYLSCARPDWGKVHARPHSFGFADTVVRRVLQRTEDRYNIDVE